MKSFKQFCVDASINEEWWSPFTYKPNIPSPPKPPMDVLAYKNYKSGVLNKDSGKFTQRQFTSPEQKRYGWKPVQVSSYSKQDTPGDLTASGEKFTDNARGVAVPYKSKINKNPSIPFGTKLQITSAPGTGAPVAKTHSFDTGNFGKTGDYNKNVNFDLSRKTAAEVSGNPNITSQQFGKRMVYVKNEPTTLAKIKPSGK
jgi:hypothetical protein